jgi:RNA polymerase sigma-70 factor (ECF subfamily)
MIGRFEGIGLGDTVLLEKDAAASRDEEFSAMVARHSRFVYRVAYTVLRNAHDAEDAAQEVFLKLYRLWRPDPIRDERAYLSRLAWRAAIDRLKKRGPAAGREDSNSEAPSPALTPEQAVLEADWSAVVHRMIDALPDDLRLPLALSATGDLKSGEIAQLLGIPEGTVRTRVMKARAVLKQKLSASGGGRYGR